MPELPEVENYKKYLDGTALHQAIDSFSCRDDRLLKMSETTFREHLMGVSFTASERIGKYLFVHTDGDRILVMHFGMTGRLSYYKDAEDRPRFAHIVFGFANGFHLAFENKRKFGWIDLAESVESYKAEKGLSDDARKLSWQDFYQAVQNRKTAIKSILLDQSVAAGLGNWMVDEILYQAKIHPASKNEHLTKAHLQTIYDKMKAVIETAIEKEAVYSEFPNYYLMHNRSTDGKCFHTGNPIQKTKVGGRSTYYSEEWQSLIS